MGSIHPSVKIGPGVIIEENVNIGKGCEIGAYSILNGPTNIGADNIFYPHTIIGADPQDKKFIGGGTLTIGDRNKFREFVSVHRGHLSDEGTIVGDDNDFLCNSHIGHDCRIGNHNFIANNVLLAGHVHLGDYVNISGLSGIHQFCRVGNHVMISGLTGVRNDIYSYSIVMGNPALHVGVNHVGLSRNGWSKSDILKVKEAFRGLRNNEEMNDNAFYYELLEVKENSDRGMAKFAVDRLK